MPLALEALGLWHELEQHTELELLRQTGGVIIGPEGTPEILCATASAEDNSLTHEALDAATLRPRFPQHVVRDGERRRDRPPRGVPPA